jgi:Polyketide cyclase / dehydrase and lipid transport
MRHHTVTATFAAPPEEVFAYLADIDNLPEWATEFARELRLVDGRYKVVNGLGEFFFEIHADAESGVIDMLAGPREDALQLFPTRVVPWPKVAALSPSRCSRRGSARPAIRGPVQLAPTRAREPRVDVRLRRA